MQKIRIKLKAFDHICTHRSASTLTDHGNLTSTLTFREETMSLFQMSQAELINSLSAKDRTDFAIILLARIPQAELTFEHEQILDACGIYHWRPAEWQPCLQMLAAHLPFDLASLTFDYATEFHAKPQPPAKKNFSIKPNGIGSLVLEED